MPTIQTFVYTDFKKTTKPQNWEHFPNRNMTVHGEFGYDSRQASINMIFIADIMLRGVSVSHHKKLMRDLTPPLRRHLACSRGRLRPLPG
jgi:hypothetical protein